MAHSAGSTFLAIGLFGCVVQLAYAPVTILPVRSSIEPGGSASGRKGFCAGPASGATRGSTGHATGDAWSGEPGSGDATAKRTIFTA